MTSSFRLPGLLVVLVALSLIAPAAASASHIEGGSITSKITSNGRCRAPSRSSRRTRAWAGSAPARWRCRACRPRTRATSPARSPTPARTRAAWRTGRPRRAPSTSTSTRCGARRATVRTPSPRTGSARVGGILNGGSSVATFNTRVTKGFRPVRRARFQLGRRDHGSEALSVQAEPEPGRPRRRLGAVVARGPGRTDHRLRHDQLSRSRLDDGCADQHVQQRQHVLVPGACHRRERRLLRARHAVHRERQQRSAVDQRPADAPIAARPALARRR